MWAMQQEQAALRVCVQHHLCTGGWGLPDSSLYLPGGLCTPILLGGAVLFPSTARPTQPIQPWPLGMTVGYYKFLQAFFF